MPKSLITGITGQDGSYLAELLLEKDYEVHGMVRRISSHPKSLKNIEHIKHEISLHFGDLENEHHLCSLVHKLKPEEIYNLASQSDVKVSFDIPEYTGDVTGLGTTRLLEAVRQFSPKSKVYQASSSEMFGTSAPPQNENGPFRPQNPYAAAKLYSHHMCRIYREGYGLFIACGILFNHESPRRGINFVTRKITMVANEIAVGNQQFLYLGNLDAKRDWGYAPDYVNAMWLMLQRDRADDFVIGTGEVHTVREFVEEAFSLVGLNWEDYVRVDPALYRPAETVYLHADIRKAEAELGWKPSVTFKELVRIMMDADKLEKEGKVGHTEKAEIR